MLGLFSRVRGPAIAVVAAAITLAAAGTAGATGTVKIQQADGSINTYDNVKIQILHQTLNVTTADGTGTLIIYRAACTSDGDVTTCLPTGATLVQGGDVNPIKIVQGTVYANVTDDPHQLSLSTMTVPAHGVIMALKTLKGTYITMNGTIDKVTK